MKNVLALIEIRDRNEVLLGASVVDINDMRDFICRVLDSQSYEKACEFAKGRLTIECLQNVEDGALCAEYGGPDMVYPVHSVYDDFSIESLPAPIMRDVKEFLYDAEK